MSAASAVSSLLSTLESLSSSYRAGARALVKAADDRLIAIETPPPVEVRFAVEQAEGDYTRIPHPPTLNGIGELDLPDHQEIQDVSQISDEFTETVPTLSGLPTFRYGAIPAAPEFTDESPPIGAMPDEPTVPEIQSPTFPDLTPPLWIESPDPATVDIPEILPPSPIPEFTEDLFSRYREYLELADGEVAEWLAYLNENRAELAPTESLLAAHLRNALQGDGVWPDAWERRTFERSQQAAFLDRHAAVFGADGQPSSQTGMPSGSSVASLLRIELKALDAIANAAGQAADSRQEREAKHIQQAAEIALRLVDAAMELKARCAGWKLKMLALALDGADSTLDIAIRVIDFKRAELELTAKYNKSQIAGYELRLKAEQTKVESLRIEVANNKLIGKYDEQQMAAYDAAIAFVDSRVRLFSARIEYVKLEVEHRKIALSLFESEVSAYKATVNAKLSEIAAIKASIKGDLALAEKEWAKVRLFEASLAKELANASAMEATVSAQVSQAKSLLNEYKTTLTAQLQYLESAGDHVKIAMDALIQGVRADATEQELKISSKELTDSENIINALHNMRVEQMELSAALQSHKVVLSQISSQSKIIDGGASTLGGIASAAFQGLNSVAVTELAEEA